MQSLKFLFIFAFLALMVQISLHAVQNPDELAMEFDLSEVKEELHTAQLKLSRYFDKAVEKAGPK